MKYNKIIRNFALMVVASSTLIACDDFLGIFSKCL